MKKENTQKKYCSLDIETSDFDPAKGEVLEVGLVFFEVNENNLVIESEWQSLFKPSGEVSPRILALTNISLSDLADAPAFSEKKEELQEILKDRIIVGHNIDFDIKFLEGFGVKFSGLQIDTLDLAQIFLPTNSSYNLESLMNHLEVDHKDAHRALADAKATLVVVEKLLAIYCALPDETKTSLENILSAKDFPEIHELLRVKFEPKAPVDKQADVQVSESKEITESLKGTNKIITFPLGFDYYSYIYGALQKSKEKILLVVPTKKLVYQLWKQDLAHPIFENKDIFDDGKFKMALQKNDLSPEQKKFLAKILVWQSNNWQNKVLYDLNFTISGQQHRSLISYSKKDQEQWAVEDHKVLTVDYLDFINLDLAKKYPQYKVLILDLSNFEQALTFVFNRKISASDFNYSLKQIGSGKEIKNAEKKVEKFFEFAQEEIGKINSNVWATITVDKKFQEETPFKNLKEKAQGLVLDLSNLNKILDSDRLAAHIESLEIFFSPGDALVKWIELGENRFTFWSSPASLEKISEQKISGFKKIIFTASLGSESLIKYFIDRLKLKDFEIYSMGQQELRPKLVVRVLKDAPLPENLLGLLAKVNTPTALLMPSVSSLRNFYEPNFVELKNKYKVWAQSYSGGTNKILENFGSQENSVLIVTDNFINKQVGRNLKVKSLILTRIPFEQFTHPLFAAQAEKYENKFLDFNIPRALYNFHTLIRFFFSDDLQEIYIMDPKIHKEYGKYFLDYLKSIPFVDIVQE